jgi:hypothetical protein
VTAGWIDQLKFGAGAAEASILPRMRIQNKFPVGYCCFRAIYSSAGELAKQQSTDDFGNILLCTPEGALKYA